MGCVSSPAKITIVSKIINNKVNHKPNKSASQTTRTQHRICKISSNNWINILDYLSFTDLKESGKVCKKFNIISKKHQILIKFFQNKKSNIFEHKLTSSLLPYVKYTST